MQKKQLLLSAVVLTLSVAWNQQAQACGGFFCAQQPVDQTAERILFALSPNKVTAHIQINYQGEADKFSWIVPVQAVPNIKLGSQSVFTTLDRLTRPQFRTDMSALSGSCSIFSSGGAVDAGVASPDRAVDVIDAKQVGPFDTVTLQSKSTDELTKWLANNGYTQPPNAIPLIDHYVKLGMYFVAVKLSKSASVGEIAPLVLEMDTGEACVPLVLTQIAATPDMPVIVYVLGAARAFPRNWFHVTVDLAQINWLTGGSNYQQVATAAINEAAGHGFITEFAGKSLIAANQFYTPSLYNTAALVNETNPIKVVNILTFSGFPRDATMLSILRQFVPMPATLAQMGVTDAMFYNSIAQYEAELAGFTVDSAGLIKAIQERIVAPMREAQDLVNAHPYLTRLMSTVSPEEMNRDPLFLLNPDLSDVSNVHTAKVSGMCENSGTVNNMKLTLEDGRVLSLGDTPLFGAPAAWPYATMLPFARSIELLGSSGAPVRIKRSEVVRIDRELDQESPDVVRARAAAQGATEPEAPLVNPPPVNQKKDDGGCAFGGGGAAGWLALLAALAWVVARSRTKRSRNH